MGRWGAIAQLHAGRESFNDLIEHATDGGMIHTNRHAIL